VNKTFRQAAKFVGRQTVGRLPRGTARLTGRLAVDGGEPVRNVRYRPWPSQAPTLPQWLTSVGPAFRSIFLSGAEGLPQTWQKRFASEWASYCGCRHTAPTRCVSPWRRRSITMDSSTAGK
jgi:hypothetical protein